MCGRFILTQEAMSLQNRYKATLTDSDLLHPSYNIAPGQRTVVVTNEQPGLLQLYRFGLTPSWSQKPSLFINARAEGDLNSNNDPNYAGEMAIFDKPSFRKPIRSQRCLVPADAFIEGSTKEKLSKPFLVYLKNKVRPFSFAGIWDRWTNPENGELISSFAIITTTPNRLMQRIPHHRMPVILKREDESRWLSNILSVDEIVSLLRPYPAELMNAYPIAPTIKNPLANDRALIHPAGGWLFVE